MKKVRIVLFQVSKQKFAKNEIARNFEYVIEAKGKESELTAPTLGAIVASQLYKMVNAQEHLKQALGKSRMFKISNGGLLFIQIHVNGKKVLDTLSIDQKVTNSIAIGNYTQAQFETYISTVLGVMFTPQGETVKALAKSVVNVSGVLESAN